MKSGIGLLLLKNLKALNLSTMVQHLRDHLSLAKKDEMDYEEFLLGLTEIELKARAENRYMRLLREAKFPQVKSLSTFDLDAAPELDRELIKELASQEYIIQRNNIILQGKSGTGKTHLAIALGVEACKQGYTTRFVTACDLVNQLVEAREERHISRLFRKYGRCRLLVLDELGYVPLSKEGANLLFQLLAQRQAKRSMIITTNLEFADWTKVFGDPNLTTTLLERLTYRSHIINCNWESYRLRENPDQQAIH